MGYVELRVLPADTVLPPPPTMPPAPTRASDLRELALRAGSALIGRHVPARAATDLTRAAFHLGAAEVVWTIGAGLGGDVIDARRQAVFGQTYDILEMATMSLGFGSTMSALDLDDDGGAARLRGTAAGGGPGTCAAEGARVTHRSPPTSRSWPAKPATLTRCAQLQRAGDDFARPWLHLGTAAVGDSLPRA